MLWQAARDLGIDLGASILIGDALTDAQAAQAAGVKPILVLTGLGGAQTQGPEAAQRNHILAVPDLATAIELVLRETHWPMKTPPK